MKLLSDVFGVYLVTVLLSISLWLIFYMVLVLKGSYRHNMDIKFGAMSRSFTDNRPVKINQIFFILFMPVVNMIVGVYLILYACTDYKDGIGK